MGGWFEGLSKLIEIIGLREGQPPNHTHFEPSFWNCWECEEEEGEREAKPFKYIYICFNEINVTFWRPLNVYKYNTCNVINSFNSVLGMNRISYILVVWLID